MSYTLDSTFGSGGKVITDISGGDDDYAYSMVLDSNNNIFVAGNTNVGGNNDDFVVVKYNSTGTLDSTFGDNGKVITDIRGGHDYAFSMVLDSYNNIFVAGYGNNSFGGPGDFVVVKYNSTGTLDSTFGDNGKVITDISEGNDYATSMVLDSDNNIFVAGYGGDALFWGPGDFVVVKYNSTGTLDSTFGDNGKVITDISGSDDYAYSMALDSNNNIFVAGSGFNGSDHDFVVVKYDMSGTLDSTFGSGGKVITDISGGHDTATSMVLDSNNNIFVAGYGFNGSDHDFVVVKYDMSGTLDSTFGDNGKVITDISGGDDDNAYSMVLDSNNNIFVAGIGYTNVGGNNDDFIVVKYDSTGTLDSTFGSGGKVITDISGGDDYAHSMVLDSYNNIFVAGTHYNVMSAYGDFVVVKYTQVLNTTTSNICFIEGTLVNTDQGNIPIEHLKPNINTINKKPIQYITKTFSADPKLVMVKKHALYKNIPNKDTIMSGFHKIQIDGQLIEAYKLSYINKNVGLVDNTNEPLYNILMENHEIISVQNMSVESLHPENIIAKLYKSNLPKDKKNKLIEEISIATKTEDYEKYDLIKNCIL